MLTGSFASAYHAVPRATQDIDLVIAPSRSQLAELARAFPAPAYYCEASAALAALEEESLFNVIDLATGWKIDFIIRKSREYSLIEFARRQPIVFEGLDSVTRSRPLDWAAARTGDSPSCPTRVRRYV
jgi:hypothetical protein